MSSDAILERLTQLHPRLIDLDLGRVRRLLAALGDPQDRLPPVVHVAGTNGKGSLVAYLRAIAEAAGYRVHVYTSPHLVRFHERIRVAGALIEEDWLAAVLEELETRHGQQPITLFEITTAAALHAFAQVPADLTLLEVGMGGRFDATNVVARPALTAITPIGFDHTQFLGDSLDKIAAEKAGILKPGVPAVVGRQRSVPALTIATQAQNLGAPLFRMDEEWRVSPAGEGLRYESATAALNLPSPGLPGRHQFDNAGTAIAAVECLRTAGLRIDDSAIARGLRAVEWPARLQRLRRGPLVDAMPEGCELWLDGGHNVDCGLALARMAEDWAREPAALPLYLIFGMGATKDATGFIAPLARYARAGRAVPIPGHQSFTAAEAAAKAEEAGLVCVPDDDVHSALEDLLAGEPAPMRVLICGSLYLAGHVLALQEGVEPQAN
jgi:dihydrofolate synthase/folylpolyglutamate synthase